MATRSEANDPAVDELKRRARRRLVGAIVLVLAAAVLLPLLLENEPKPLGEDVSIQIPPIDNGRFINPLSPGKAQDPKAKGSVAMGANDMTTGGPSSATPSSPAPAKAENAERSPGTSATPSPAAAPEPKAAETASVAKAPSGAANEASPTALAKFKTAGFDGMVAQA